MRIPFTRWRRFGGVVAVLVLAVGGLVTAAGPAAASPTTEPCDFDPAGVIFLSSDTVVSGDQITVGWDIRNVSCPPVPVVEQMSGPGFGDGCGQVLTTLSGSRTVTVTQPGPSIATWTLNIRAVNRTICSPLDQESATVLPRPPLVNGLAGGAVAFADAGNEETKAQENEIVIGDGPRVMSGTSPSLANVAGDYEAAYQGSDGHLWVVSPAGAASDTGLGMMAGTSPSITATDATNFEVAFQANTSLLWTYSSVTGARRVGPAMTPGTSPSATLTSAGVAIAYVNENGMLCVIDPVLGFGGYQAPVAAGTSPAITYIRGLADGYRITYQAPDHQVRTADSTSAQTSPTPLTAAPGTSPAITTLPSGEIDIAVNGSDGTVQILTPAGITRTNERFQSQTSPSIAPAAGGGAVTAWQDVSNIVATFSPGTGVTHTGRNMFLRSSPSIAQITSTTR